MRSGIQRDELEVTCYGKGRIRERKVLVSTQEGLRVLPTASLLHGTERVDHKIRGFLLLPSLIRVLGPRPLHLLFQLTA